jgi:hypothetical protein
MREGGFRAGEEIVLHNGQILDGRNELIRRGPPRPGWHAWGNQAEDAPGRTFPEPTYGTAPSAEAEGAPGGGDQDPPPAPDGQEVPPPHPAGAPSQDGAQ